MYHSSKYIGLALTEFNKNTVFYRVYMWLQLSQIKKKNSTKETRENQHLFITLTSQTSEKHVWDTHAHAWLFI